MCEKQRISPEVNNLCWKWSDVCADTNEDYASINLLSRCSCMLLTNSHIPVTTSIFPARLNNWFCNELRYVLHEHRFLVLARTNNDGWSHKFKLLDSQVFEQRWFCKQNLVLWNEDTVMWYYNGVHRPVFYKWVLLLFFMVCSPFCSLTVATNILLIVKWNNEKMSSSCCHK